MHFLSPGCRSTTFPRSFVERLIGCMLNPQTWVTRAIGAICPEAHCTTLYKLIEHAHVSVAQGAIRLLQLLHRVSPGELENLTIDDTRIARCASSGPGVRIRHDHSRKAN